jgi:hypothetical protein
MKNPRKTYTKTITADDTPHHIEICAKRKITKEEERWVDAMADEIKGLQSNIKIDFF